MWQCNIWSGYSKIQVIANFHLTSGNCSDLVIGKDVVLEEFEPLSDLLNCLPSKAQLGPKSFVDQVKGFGLLKEYGVKSLLTSLKEKAQDNLKAVKIDYTCFDVSYDVVVLGSNLGVVFLYDRTCKKLSRLSTEVTYM